jgi:TonB family protein
MPIGGSFQPPKRHWISRQTHATLWSGVRLSLMADRSDIFEQSAVGETWQPRRPLPVSIALHVIFFMLLLRGRTPIFVAPTATLGGVHGSSVTHLYWAKGTSPVAATGKDSAPKHHLVWQKPQPPQPDQPPPSEDARTETASAPSPTAGSPYGSLSDGASAGEEIRPALPAVTSEPRVNPEDLLGIAEGNVIVEITIDERGAIVSKAVMKSMGPAIDGKVLAALESWRFHPATRDGVPIPSKQDVVYHFKPRPS